VPFVWEFPEVQWSLMSGRSMAALVYLTIFATIAAYLFYNHALTKIPAARAAVFINGIPLVTIAGAWFFLEETLTLIQAGGGFLVLTAIFITSFPDLKAADTRINPVKGGEVKKCLDVRACTGGKKNTTFNIKHCGICSAVCPYRVKNALQDILKAHRYCHFR
jgi:multidrug transporter EmrE-like cation transporter